MPSVRVRPTLKNEVKQRVMKVKMPDDAKDEMINLEDLEDRVLMSVKKSKRANIGGENYQMELIENCRKEIAQSLNLDEIRKSLDGKMINKAPIVHHVQVKGDASARTGSQISVKEPSADTAESQVAAEVKIKMPRFEDSQAINHISTLSMDGFINDQDTNRSPKKRHESLYSRHQHLFKRFERGQFHTQRGVSLPQSSLSMQSTLDDKRL